MRKLLGKADAELATVERLMRDLRKRIANAAEHVRLAAEKAARVSVPRARTRVRAKSR